MGAALELGILGPLEVRIDGGDPVALGGARQRALLAVLVLHAREVVSTDSLVDQLWGEQPPATATHTVQVFVSRLRRALGVAGDRLITRPPGYVLEVDRDELDSGCCERLCGEARAALAGGDAEAAARLLRDALRLWRGPPLTEFTYEPFAQGTIARLEELRNNCREELIEAELALGHHAEVVSELEALVHEHPFRERPRGQLMLALYRCGRQADALEAFQRARHTLIDELAVEPSVALRELEQAILRQDPSLLLAAVPADAVQEPAARRLTAAAASAHLGGLHEEAFTATLRKTATVVVVKLATTERSDPEVGRRVIGSARAEVERIVAHHGGTFVSGVGGQAVGLFGLPVTREDDALRAVRAAYELRQVGGTMAARGGGSLRIGVGIDTGEVVADAPDDVFGEPLGSAAAFSLVCQPEEVLLGDSTRRLVLDAIRVEPALDGTAWRLVELVTGAGPTRPRLDVPIVGRSDEFATACALFVRTARARNAHMLVVTGDAGIGKSRLACELVEQLRVEATVLSGRCLSYGEGVGLWPLREALSEMAGGESRAAIRGLLAGESDADVVADVVSEALGLSEAEASPEQVPWAFRRLLEMLAGERPLLLVIDDAHSAGEELLKLLTYLIDWLTAPVLIVCLARPDLFDSRPDWGREDPRGDWHKHPRVEMLKLAPLSQAEADALLDLRLDERRLSPGERARIIETAEGNPLFMEQLVAMSGEDPWWDRGRVPATIQSLLAARLDRLGPGERAVVERAAVIGRGFWPSAVVELLPADARATCQDHLRELVHRGLIEPERSTVAGEEQLRFHHMLIRDVAYAGTPKTLRGELHERFADWLAPRGEAYDEFVGFHLEESHRYRAELDAPTVDLVALASRAGDALASAGRRARARGDTNAAVRLLRRAARLMETSGQRRPEIALELGSAMCESGDFSGAEPLLQAALDEARATGAKALEAHAVIELSYWRSRAHGTARAPELRSVSEHAIPIFTRCGDEAGLARAWLHIAWAHWQESRCADMEAALEKALGHAERGQESRWRSYILIDLASTTVIGPRAVDDAILRCRAIRERATGDIQVTAFADAMLGVLEAMAGRVAIARDLWRDSKARLSEYGLTLTVAGVQMYYALIELIAGSPARAEPELLSACSTFEQIGDQNRLSSAAALLARVLCAQGRFEESERYSALSRDASSEDDAASQVYWRGAHARVLAREGHPAAAEAVADQAVSRAQATDSLLLQGDALSDRADVHAVLNQPERAAQDIEQAISCYARKGIRPCVDRARDAQQALMSPVGDTMLAPPAV